MAEGWENLEPAPIEFLHDRLMRYFHEFRRSKTENESVEIRGLEFNDIIAKAKVETLAKYPNQNLGEPIPKSNHS